jgi:hypothetical protein
VTNFINKIRQIWSCYRFASAIRRLRVWRQMMRGELCGVNIFITTVINSKLVHRAERLKSHWPEDNMLANYAEYSIKLLSAVTSPTLTRDTERVKCKNHRERSPPSDPRWEQIYFVSMELVWGHQDVCHPFVTIQMYTIYRALSDTCWVWMEQNSLLVTFYMCSSNHILASVWLAKCL